MNFNIIVSITLTISLSFLFDVAAQCPPENNVTLLFNANTFSIRDSEYQYCSSIVAVVIPSTMTFIGEQAFRNCYSLKTALLTPGTIYLIYIKL